MRSAKERLMEEALAIITGDRRKDYGPPERNFDRIGLLWTAYLRAAGLLGVTAVLNGLDVCRMQALLKLCRRIETPNHEDSFRDQLGYDLCEIDLVLDAKKGWIDWPPSMARGDIRATQQQQPGEAV